MCYNVFGGTLNLAQSVNQQHQVLPTLRSSRSTWAVILISPSHGE